MSGVLEQRHTGVYGIVACLFLLETKGSENGKPLFGETLGQRVSRDRCREYTCMSCLHSARSTDR